MGLVDKLRALMEHDEGTGGSWGSVLRTYLSVGLSDGIQPVTVPPDVLRDVCAHVLLGEGSLAGLQQAMAATRSPNFGRYLLGREFYQQLDALCLEITADEVPRWARFVEVMVVVEHRRRTPPPGTDRWLTQLLRHVARNDVRASPGVTSQFLLAVAEELGDPADDVIRHALRPAPATWMANQVSRVLSHTPDWGDAVRTHRELISAALVGGAVEVRRSALTLLEDVDAEVLDEVVDALAVAATASSTTVRDLAQPLLPRAGRAPALAALRVVAREGKPDARFQALSLMWALAEDGDDVREDLRALAAADRAASVKGLLDVWDAAPAPDEDVAWELPEEDPVRWGTDPGTARRVAEQVIATIAADRASLAAAAHQRMAAGRGHEPTVDYTPPGRDDLEAVTAALTSTSPPALPDDLLSTISVGRVVFDLVDDPDVTTEMLLQLVTVLDDRGVMARRGRGRELVEARHAAVGAPTLLQLQRLLDDGGLDGAAEVWSLVSRSWAPLAARWPDEDVWPFVAVNVDLVLGDNREAWGVDNEAPYRLVGTLPVLPARVVDRLYDIALSGGKLNRTRAQHVLRDHPERAVRAASALTQGKADLRLAAATWLTEIGSPEVLPQLVAAWAAERQDTVRGALLDALEAVGEDPATHLSRERLEADATAAVAKGTPKALDWLAWDQLPDVRWADGTAVSRVVVQGLAAQAVKSGSPEPNAILRRACAMLDRDDAERLAEQLLAAWLAEDLRPAPGGPPDVPAGSAAASKGLLALVAACGGHQVVAPAERYLRDWYGKRASQGKSLLAMLSWVEHPAATQLVLSVGSRFRTKTFQDEAVRLAAALAERKGWTLEELADRTIPTAGLGADGVLRLSYGPREFTARLQGDLTLQLHGPDGGVVRTLPAPRQSDDAEAAQASKKALSAARKALKSIERIQRERLYEALCSTRTWLAADWQEHLAAHPVVRHHVRRLVWLARPDTPRDDAAGPVSAPVTFRLLEDGTLTDVEDDEVVLDPGWRVELAHQTTIPAELAASWAEHLADYEVVPLFQQLGRDVYELPEALRGETTIPDFRGHVVESFQLRGRAGKLGWERGPVEDAGIFYSYRKRFASLGLTAQIGITGSALPEESRPIALTELGFLPAGEDGTRHDPVPLRDVPPVLLSECHGDVASLAALGTGFDPDWEKITQW